MTKKTKQITLQMKEAPYEMWKDFEALDFYQQVNNKGTEHSIEYCY